MSPAQYDAIMEIAENGERFAPQDLNVPRRTVASLARRGWIAIAAGRAIVTPAGWLAVERDVARDNISK
jgi:hypothetical protein